jgi:chromate transporter
MSSAPPEAPKRSHVLEVLRTFLVLGTTAFGGPAAHVARMQKELVEERGWVEKEEFTRLLGVAQLLPGPTSSEMAMLLGARRAGGVGLVVAGLAFLFPAAVMVLGLAIAYRAYGSLPRTRGVLDAVQAAVIAVLVEAIAKLLPSLAKNRLQLVVACAGAIAALAGAPELAVVATGGLVVAAGPEKKSAVMLFFAPVAAAGKLAAGPSLLGLSAAFLKIGALLVGSGYVLVPFLRAELVDARGWLGETELLDAVAAGQVTPGPLFTTATFVGYLLRGVPGAVLATAAIFLPAFVYAALGERLLSLVEKHPRARAFFDGAGAASLGLIAATAVGLGRGALRDVPTLLIAIVSAALLLGARVSATWVLAGAAAIGLFRG